MVLESPWLLGSPFGPCSSGSLGMTTSWGGEESGSRRAAAAAGRTTLGEAMGVPDRLVLGVPPRLPPPRAEATATATEAAAFRPAAAAAAFAQTASAAGFAGRWLLSGGGGPDRWTPSPGPPDCSSFCGWEGADGWPIPIGGPGGAAVNPKAAALAGPSGVVVVLGSTRQGGAAAALTGSMGPSTEAST